MTPQTIEVAVNEAILGQKSPSQALAEAQDDANQLLEEVRARFEG